MIPVCYATPKAAIIQTPKGEDSLRYVPVSMDGTPAHWPGHRLRCASVCTSPRARPRITTLPSLCSAPPPPTHHPSSPGRSHTRPVPHGTCWIPATLPPYRPRPCWAWLNGAMSRPQHMLSLPRSSPLLYPSAGCHVTETARRSTSSRGARAFN